MPRCLTKYKLEPGLTGNGEELMATKAYILIETAVGKTHDVSDSLSKLEDVVNVDAVTGPYDIISIVSCTDLSSVGELVTNEIHTIQGIVRTVTCLSV
ncbi:MAG TPA: Lrp/AsnC family transcriptional regulator [Dehalococcoidia bacterium]|nr:Lrp/AsnC family transcriptional regulator [Dehalococcoidia bacterium]